MVILNLCPHLHLTEPYLTDHCNHLLLEFHAPAALCQKWFHKTLGSVLASVVMTRCEQNGLEIETFKVSDLDGGLPKP